MTCDPENSAHVVITGQTDAQATRERILRKLHIPDDLHTSFAIYRTELGGFAIGGALGNNQLLIDCQHFGDDHGSLRFLAQRANAPTDNLNIPVMPPSNATPAPPMLSSQSTVSPGAMHMPSTSRRTGSVSPTSDRLAHLAPLVNPLPDPNLAPPSRLQARPSALVLLPFIRRQPTSALELVVTQLRVVILLVDGHAPKGVTPTPPDTRSSPRRDANQFNDPAVASVVLVRAPNHARRPPKVDSAFERDL
ncbi:hypothetical protein FRC09_005026 [Ceratobasidium sp. 395]|nr:hypothetical protein FRC09_005026 [Ceratobasidium sp. 395]